MVDSSSHSDPQSTHLPVEIVEKIIQNACTTHWHHAPTLSSIALTSHVLRLHANNARFSGLFLIQSSYVPMDKMVNSARRLVDVIEAGKSVPSGMPGILHFSTSLSIEIMGTHDDVMGGLADASWAYIFRALFRGPVPDKPSQEYGLSMALYRERATIPSDDVWRDGARKYVGIDWRGVSPDFVDAFIDLAKHSHLNSLLLEYMRNVPKSIFEGSGIKLLELRDVTVGAESAASLDNVNCPVHVSPLQSLSMGSVLFSDIGLNLHQCAHGGGLLSSLINLSVGPSRNADLADLKMALLNAPSLQMLDVSLYGLFSIDTRRLSIPPGALPSLSHIRISTFGSDPGLPLAISFLKALHNVKSLRRLNLVLQGGNFAGNVGAIVVFDHLVGTSLENLNTHLSLPSLSHLGSIVVHLNVYNGVANRAGLQKDLTAYITHKLQSVKERLVVKVDVM